MHGLGSPSIQVGAGTFQNLKSSGGERFVVCSVFSCQMASGEVLLLSSAPPMEERRGRVKALLPTQLNTAVELQHHWSQLTGAEMRWHTNSTFYRTTSAMGATTTSGTHRTSDGFFGTPFLRRKKGMCTLCPVLARANFPAEPGCCGGVPHQRSAKNRCRACGPSRRRKQLP
jgi:hypothetical protein